MLTAFYEWLAAQEVVDQKKSEAAIALLTLIYQADGKIRHAEQRLFESFLNDLPWQRNAPSKAVYHRDMIAKSRASLAQHHVEDYLNRFVPELKGDPRILSMLRELVLADGHVHSNEANILSMILAKMV